MPQNAPRLAPNCSALMMMMMMMITVLMMGTDDAAAAVTAAAAAEGASNKWETCAFGLLCICCTPLTSPLPLPPPPPPLLFYITAAGCHHYHRHHRRLIDALLKLAYNNGRRHCIALKSTVEVFSMFTNRLRGSNSSGRHYQHQCRQPSIGQKGREWQ